MAQDGAATPTDASSAAPEDPSSTLLSKGFVVLLVIAAIVGVLVSLAAWCFVELIYQIQRELHTHLPSAVGYHNGPPLWWSLPILAIAGLITAFAIERGGIAPPQRRRSRLALGLLEREEISRGIAAGESGRAIARRLGRSPATICHEIARHGGRGRYRAAEADRRAWDNARRPQRCKLALHPALCKLVASKLSEDWSPEQIAGWLKLSFARRQPDCSSHPHTVPSATKQH